ncbi:hypothetical protein B0A49_07355 [Cryomyces minteri]|uniref:Serine/threonine-protein kinase psk1 n=1 Tax=Cryomyces minteri TaxID=331657 RepID=A0A4U0X6D3_9PEZI|nr:hypothetical protein B0A49_07355 [Cryomyces minteri]
MFAFDLTDQTVSDGTDVDHSMPSLHQGFEAMQIDTHNSLGIVHRSPPMKIASPAPSAHLHVNGSRIANEQLVEPKLNHDEARNKAAKRKKKKRVMKPGAPAMTTIRGFQTPVTSGGEESDFSSVGTPRLTPRIKDLASGTASPGLRTSPSSGRVSALKLQLDAMDLEDRYLRSSSVRSTSEVRTDTSNTPDTMSDSDKTEMESYEVKLENDFVSPDVHSKPMLGAVEGGFQEHPLTRKMAASDFEPLMCLGKGAFGTVHLVKHAATGRLYAQKQFRKASLTVHKRLVEQTKTERVILESVNRHPFVVKLYYAFQDHEKLYLILEYAQGGELFTHLAMERMFTEDVAAFYMAEMVLALEHLHRNVGVIYRDLKPENCLLDSEGHLLLTDFGLSKVSVDENETYNSILGTIDYMAPEVILGADYGMAVDWWSFGAIGYDLLTGSPPFQGNNHAKIQEKILKQKLAMPYFLSGDASDLLTRLLRKDPKKRLGSNMPKDLQTIKKHRFFRKIDWTKLERRELDPPIKPLITNPELAENFSREFTELAMSPVATRGSAFDRDAFPSESDPFGGFSFVASRSLLECGDWGV